MRTEDGPLRDLAHRPRAALAPVGRVCRRAGQAATGPRARTGLKVAGGAVAVVALAGAALVGLDKLGFDGSAGLEAITFGSGSGNGDEAKRRSHRTQPCQACGGRGVVPPGLDCPECLGSGFAPA
jgi:hypothetical protein